MDGRQPDDYRYGHSPLAGDRLRLLASVFEPTTRAFLVRAAARPVGLAVDLGCGPGYTTALVQSALEPARTVGIEFSADFVARARLEHGGADLAFFEHDVTQVPFPVGPADLVFARYLLSHLPSPMAVVGRWLGQLRPGGRLLLEEAERIDTTSPTFERYLELTVAMLASHGTDMYI